MNVRNCRVCGKIFNYVMGPMICPRCREESEAKFQEVKLYIQEHRNADIRDVSEDCGVTGNQIRQWIREERLQFSEDSPVQIACEKCGDMIRSGRFCAKCKAEMTNGFNEAFKIKKPQTPSHPEPKKGERSKMRFL